jgi:DNA-binding beta-propeller fold protein YncE
VFTVPNTSLGLVNPAYPSFTVNLPGAFWVAVTPDGTLAYVTSPNSSAVFVVNTSPTTCKTWGGTTIPMWGSPYGVAIAPF